MKRKLIGMLGAAMLMAGMANAATTVSSYSPPKLVSEINTALAAIETSGSLTTPTISAGTLTGASKLTNSLTGLGSAIVTNVAIEGSTVGAIYPLAGAFTTLSASSTLQVTGVGTFTAESVHNGGIDTDYVTVDAEAGVDCKSAGALKLGITTATSVDIGGSTETTTIKGLLNVDEADSFDTTLTVAGKGVVVDSSANVQLIQTTNVTMHSGTVWTQTWSTVFGAAPTTVIVTPTELHAAVPFVSSITPSNLLVTVEADKNFILTCIGTK